MRVPVQKFRDHPLLITVQTVRYQDKSPSMMLRIGRGHDPYVGGRSVISIHGSLRAPEDTVVFRFHNDKSKSVARRKTGYYTLSQNSDYYTLRLSNPPDAYPHSDELPLNVVKLNDGLIEVRTPARDDILGNAVLSEPVKPPVIEHVQEVPVKLPSEQPNAEEGSLSNLRRLLKEINRIRPPEVVFYIDEQGNLKARLEI